MQDTITIDRTFTTAPTIYINAHGTVLQYTEVMVWCYQKIPNAEGYKWGLHNEI